MRRVLVASNDKKAVETIKQSLMQDSTIASASTPAELLELVQSQSFDFVIADVAFIIDSNKGISSFLLEALRDTFIHGYPSSHLILLCQKSDIPSSLSLIIAGAKKYLTYPINGSEIPLTIETIEQSDREKSELEELRARQWRDERLDSLMSSSPSMVSLFKKIRAVAPTKASVFITGASGTGKGVVARLIHRHSSRCEGPFIDVHCGAIPDTLIESELFGHERGSFTGAHKRKLGKFEIAEGGTIFLDEIGAVTPLVQVKLLQVLQEGIFSRVGGESSLNADVRVIAATNADLPKLCDEGIFRQDLYYRLNVFSVELPPLIDRIEDLPMLVDTMLLHFNSIYGKGIHGIHPKVLDALFSYHWPGNIRELENVMERAYILENSSIISPESVPDLVERTRDVLSHRFSSLSATQSLASTRKDAIEAAEKSYLISLLKRHNCQIDKVVKEAQIGVRQLRRLMKRYGLKKSDFIAKSS